MPELTLAQPLSGTEVIEAVCDKIRTMLRQDCFLSPNLAYETFSANIKVSIKATDCGRTVEVDQVVAVGSDKEPDDDAALMESEANLYNRPPNEVRLESGLPIPTLVEDSSGQQQVKHVKYSKKAAVEEKPEI